MQEGEQRRIQEVEALREHYRGQIEQLSCVVASGAVDALPLDPHVVGTTDSSLTDMTIPQITLFREEIYRRCGISLTEPGTIVHSYPNASDPYPDSFVDVHKIDFREDEEAESTTLYLHESHFKDGYMTWVLSQKPDESGIFNVPPPSNRKSSGREGQIKLTEEDEAKLMLDDLSDPERARQLSAELGKIFPDYSQILDETTKKNGKICLYLEKTNENGEHQAIRLQATNRSIGYVLGFITEKKGKLAFGYKNLPAIIKVEDVNGERYEHPPTTFTFNAGDQEGRAKSLEEMLSVLNLLREHGEF